jgi:hypothetical protein
MVRVSFEAEKDEVLLGIIALDMPFMFSIDRA